MSSSCVVSLSSPPLVVVEVTPLCIRHSDSPPIEEETPSLSAPLVKLRLHQHILSSVFRTSPGCMRIKWQPIAEEGRRRSLLSGDIYSFENDQDPLHQWVFLESCLRVVPLLYFESDDPTQCKIPCWVVGYRGSATTTCFCINESTLVRISPRKTAIAMESSTGNLPSTPSSQSLVTPLTDVLSGEVDIFGSPQDNNNAMEEEVLQNHDPETIEALKLRMGLLLSRKVSVGTTPDASPRGLQHKERRRRQLRQFLQSYNGSHSLEPTDEPTFSEGISSSSEGITPLTSDGALIVHSPAHGSGKTLLATAIARRCLQCTAIHLIQPGPLLAKYGIHSDTGLETLIHDIAVNAVAKSGEKASVCVILDQLDSLLPPAVSGAGGQGDAAVPVLNAIASYLKGLTLSLKDKQQIPFPSKNQTYNLGGVMGNTFKLRLCIVGVVTCPDASSYSVSPGGVLSSLLDSLGGGQYRLPNPSSRARFQAFGRAFDAEGVKLSEEARKRLPVLAASAVSARGIAFQKVAQFLNLNVCNRLKSKEGGGSRKPIASVSELEFAFSAIQSSGSLDPSVSFATSGTSATVASTGAVENNLFSMVGGNVKAKEALEDSLALDPARRRLLSRLGFSAPTGVLLYGPPGTGKTLLAKAVAHLLKSKGGDQQTVGGAFVSLRASDIVRAEVGNSEKMIVTAFETARSNAPSVIFIDEFQALFSERGGSGSGKLTSTLLQCMDDVTHWRDAEEAVGVETSMKKESPAAAFEMAQIVVLGATNTPWMIDKAFLRPGRFDSVVHVGLPSFAERVSILSVHLRHMRVSNGDNYSPIETICESIAEKCEGFSGADLVALCRAAAIRCLDEQGEGGSVAEKHFLEAREFDVSSSSSEKLVQRISDWQP